ncbi:Beta-glucanase, GH16 family [Alkalibacterium subtropicum]|uniref:Beta-glucanase, GH16 family n=1 Tax=Alkalibacterium subtropicum TaxID=753702 RepID=A0A1I1GJ60_9LACT|nr:family 16 glycosylhydrolase [Alkalibacterium subtropicum]SFC11476.1 Beta-glucanase, GH16 family [Alkalibacterium subtropicum]
MKNKKRVAVICGLLLMGPAVLSQLQNEDAVMTVEAEEHANLLTNGDFSQGTDSWGLMHEFGGEATFTTVNDQAEVTVHKIAGIHAEWGVPISWSSQFVQENVDLAANTRYKLSFDAKSSIARPVVLEYTNFKGNLKENFYVTEEMQTFTHEFETLQAATMHLKFLIGNVQHEGELTPEEEHTLTFDNVSLVSLGEVQEDTGEKEWELTWADEFDGESLDLSKWRIDEGNGFWSGDEWIAGWGNNEKQYYHEDNVTVEDGKLILEARQEQISDEQGDYDYTSGKILSDGLFSQTFGRFEARMKLPEGQGYWPAFWMMPQDDTYGGWAASGELDIMENAGANTDKIGGAIHFGDVWPNNTYLAGDYHFDAGSTTEFNTYSVEWEPEEIRWYVNDELYYKTGDWYTEHYEYPAPFNQDFYMILNLAVGGWYGGEPDASTAFPGQVEVDYVRVYEDANANYDKSPSPLKETVEEPEEPSDDLDRDPANWEGVGENLVQDGSFDTTTTFGDPDSDATWKTFLMADHDPNGGKADFSVVDNVLNTEIQQVGWNWWQIQLMQHMQLEEGTYKLTFDMSSELARDMRVELVGSGDEIKVFPVDETEETYEMVFHVGADTESLMFGFGREIDEEELAVPYNMTLDNIVLKAAEPVEEAPAEPAPDEEDGEWVEVGDNLIEDGMFDNTTDFGTADDLSTWNIHNQGDYENWAGLAGFSVVDGVVNAEITQVGWDWWQIQLYQNLGAIEDGTYRLSFDMASDKERNVRVELVRSGLEVMDFTVNEDMNTYEAIVEIENGEDLQLLFGLGRLPDGEELETPYNVMIDNVSLTEVEFVADEEEPVDEEDPEDGDTPVDGETPVNGEEGKDDQNDDKKENETDDEKDDMNDDKDEEKDKDKSDADDEDGEKLPDTATGIWTVGALGLTGLAGGLGMKVFKKD